MTPDELMERWKAKGLCGGWEMKKQPKKPDRFERMVRAQTNNDPFMLDSDVVKLLRREHRAVMRTIERMEHYSWKDVLLKQDILDRLTKRAT